MQYLVAFHHRSRTSSSAQPNVVPVRKRTVEWAAHDRRRNIGSYKQHEFQSRGVRRVVIQNLKVPVESGASSETRLRNSGDSHRVVFCPTMGIARGERGAISEIGRGSERFYVDRLNGDGMGERNRAAHE